MKDLGYKETGRSFLAWWKIEKEHNRLCYRQSSIKRCSDVVSPSGLILKSFADQLHIYHNCFERMKTGRKSEGKGASYAKLKDIMLFVNVLHIQKACHKTCRDIWVSVHVAHVNLLTIYINTHSDSIMYTHWKQTKEMLNPGNLQLGMCVSVPLQCSKMHPE